MTLLQDQAPDPSIHVRHQRRLDGTKSLLRVATAGSVDDGKSTLIARLLLDTDSVADDHLTALHESSSRRGHAQTNLALLTDGLRAEREEGITIDVAHRFFTTMRRSFILADSPGHEQYTRNMVTGTSDADVAIVLVDARNGIVTQTRRHAYIVALTGVPHIVLAVNKMDFIEWDETTFRSIADEFNDFVHNTGFGPTVTCIPISALHGDNVATRSNAATWYTGPALLEYLENAHVSYSEEHTGGRLAVQWVIRPMDAGHHDYRGYAGQLWGGTLHVGDPIAVLPHGSTSTVTAIDIAGVPSDTAVSGQAITVQLSDHLDVGRGDLLAFTETTEPLVGTRVEADVCWMADQPLRIGNPLLIKHTTRVTRAIVEHVEYRFDVVNAETVSTTSLSPNDIGRVHLRTSTPLAADPYDVNRETGSFILIDNSSNATVAAGLIRTITT